MNAPHKDGYAAASAWWAALCARDDVSKPAAFPSGLKEAALALPQEQMCEFLDAVGEMIVTWRTAGEPSETYNFSRARVDYCLLSPHEQDSQWTDDGEPATDLARAMTCFDEQMNAEADDE